MNELYEYIAKRKSTRAYRMESLPPDQLARIAAFAKDLRPLDPSIRVETEIVQSEKVKGMLVAKAPHYLLFYSQKKDNYLVNAGFMMQQMDLFLSSLSLGSCWLGMAKTTLASKDGLAYVMMIGFGTAEDSPFRQVKDFKRKPLSEISQGQDERLEAARLAPSATNSQPWYFVCDDGYIDIYRKKLGVLKAAMYEKMNQVDMGIALCHLCVASAAKGRPFSFEYLDAAKALPVEGYTYLGRV